MKYLAILLALLMSASALAATVNTSGTQSEALADRMCDAAGHGEAALLGELDGKYIVVCMDGAELEADKEETEKALKADGVM